MRTSLAFLSFILSALPFHPAAASDWPQFLGPTRDAVYAGPALADEWPKNGPPVVWSAIVGEGYSSPIVGDGRLVICHRIGDELVVDCLDAKTGTGLWNFKHAMKFQDGAYMDSGPRPTPAIKDGRVFVHNTDGYLVCFDLKDGKKLWSQNVKSRLKSSATWHGCVSSPLVTDKAVILQVGGSNAAVAAFAPATGELLWQALDEKATASSPVLANLGGKLEVLIATRSAFHGLDPETGKDLWQYPTRKQTTGDIYGANPIVIGDQVFLSGWYKLGALLVRVKEDKPTMVWHLDDAISTHYAAAIIHDGYAYGFHGHARASAKPSLRCIELATGKIMWEQPNTDAGNIIRAGNDLLILSDTGELQLAKADPKEFKIKSRFQAVGRTTRSYPAIADGFAYVRHNVPLVGGSYPNIPPSLTASPTCGARRNWFALICEPDSRESKTHELAGCQNRGYRRVRPIRHCSASLIHRRHVHRKFRQHGCGRDNDTGRMVGRLARWLSARHGRNRGANQ